MNVSEVVRYKRAVRQFRDRPLPEEVVKEILNAGRRSQSSKNSQPWDFIAITDKTILKTLSTLGTYAGHLEDAPLGIAIITPPPEQRFSIMFDAGQSAAYMQLAAWEHGVGSCLATIYEPDQARDLLGFPEDKHLRIAISFGYPADADELTDPPQTGGRRSFEETVHINRW